MKGLIARRFVLSIFATLTDKTAKPNVVYYYQLECVSEDGTRRALCTTHLRENINARPGVYVL